VIDLKQIPEANALGLNDAALVIGGCVSLRAVNDSRLFPLLGAICGRVADHTNQCRITLGGNLCGTVIYREAAQALLLADADVTLYGPEGLRRESMRRVFDQRMRLKPGEFVLRVHVPARYIGAPFYHVKKTANEKIDYPLLSLSALFYENRARVAMSGFYAYPFRDAALEAAINNESLSGEQRVERALASLPQAPMRDHLGSGEYRRFVLRQTLFAMMEVWKH